MTTAATKAKVHRKTLGTWGRRGDQVRTLVDEKRDRVIVHYRDLAGIPRKKFFDNTREGRKAALTWGEGYHKERERLALEKTKAKERKPLTVRELWTAYKASPAFAHLRSKSKETYEARWKKWETFLGVDAIVDDTSLHDTDRFRTAAAETGMVQNQIRSVLAVARLVYNWGQSRKLVTKNELAIFRWSQPKDAVVIEPDEFEQAEFDAILKQLPPQDGRAWRAHVGAMLAGHQGQRANAVIHLKWTVDQLIDPCPSEIRWPAAYQKTGVELVQPLTWEAVSALRTARNWRERTGYTGEWILFAGGGGPAIGQALVGNARHYRKERPLERDTNYTYQAFWLALTKAEKKAGIKHRAYRGIHGLRKMAAGNVADRTGDDRLGMEWIGDVDPKQMKRYLKRRNERLDRAADAAGQTPKNA